MRKRKFILVLMAATVLLAAAGIAEATISRRIIRTTPVVLPEASTDWIEEEAPREIDPDVVTYGDMIEIVEEIQAGVEVELMGAIGGFKAEKEVPLGEVGNISLWVVLQLKTGSFVFYREYNPNLGRWLTPDPAGYRDGQNLYCYYPGPNGVDVLGLDYRNEYWYEKGFVGWARAKIYGARWHHRKAMKESGMTEAAEKAKLIVRDSHLVAQEKLITAMHMASLQKASVESHFSEEEKSFLFQYEDISRPRFRQAGRGGSSIVTGIGEVRAGKVAGSMGSPGVSTVAISHGLGNYWIGINDVATAVRESLGMPHEVGPFDLSKAYNPIEKAYTETGRAVGGEKGAQVGNASYHAVEVYLALLGLRYARTTGVEKYPTPTGELATIITQQGGWRSILNYNYAKDVILGAIGIGKDLNKMFPAISESVVKEVRKRMLRSKENVASE